MGKSEVIWVLCWALVLAGTVPTPTVPLEFPQLDQNYTFIDNSSIRENLTKHDTEISDLLLAPDEPLTTNSLPELAPVTGGTNAYEWIENGDDTEDDKFETREVGVPLMDGTVAAILVGVFLVLSVVGYVSLLLWRRSLEFKYGSREILVDKDEGLDPDDLKNFSI
ncbi:uncharacterized protein LOC103314450 [Tribolium castaneum]|uniref:Syndecan n=1 Tax=Tribolium castaneum TaxID=7070 RepID=D6X4C3_TRICA|nr:PREDICTED: uncharacterized protein LOC103314450 [Tribolium castaneum]EEZ97289.1 hypothetical protein TcasGA2_TC011094 [Tribolium castaneum]|eukprot:XP_008198771.1 PREDICTED: uncharacterized protein LOC103314450 [Tribolium castaneum]